ncbi:MAG: MBG domain-containing protein [Dorea sp.]
MTVSAADVTQTYDGNAYGVAPRASIEGATITYKDANGNYTLTESPTRTDAGETTVEFKASLEGYADAFGSATITINKRPVEIKAANASKTYGEVDPAFVAATMSGQVTGELTDVDLTVSRSDAGNNTLGTHEDVLSISQSKEALEEAYTNYTFTIKPADFTVNENETALTVSAEM